MEEELELIANSISKVRYRYNEDGKRVMNPNSAEFMKFANDKFDVIKDNFKYFAKTTSSIMYPDEFIMTISQLEGGKQLIFDNIDYILKAYNHKRNNMLEALTNIEGIEEVLLENFRDRFTLFVQGESKPVLDVYYKENFNPKVDTC